MICPKCQSNSIPFVKTWLKGGLGRHSCPDCGADCYVRESLPLTAASCCLGLLAVGLSVFFWSWSVLLVAAVVTIAADALMDYRFRRMELRGDIEGKQSVGRWWLPWHWT